MIYESLLSRHLRCGFIVQIWKLYIIVTGLKCLWQLSQLLIKISMKIEKKSLKKSWQHHCKLKIREDHMPNPGGISTNCISHGDKFKKYILELHNTCSNLWTRIDQMVSKVRKGWFTFSVSASFWNSEDELTRKISGHSPILEKLIL